MSDHGFDTTDFGTSANWRHVMHLLGLEGMGLAAKAGRTVGYRWASRTGLEVITSNDPLSGAYYDPERRDPQQGFAGYIGVSGLTIDVNLFVDAVKSVAVHIKDESVGKRDFI